MALPASDGFSQTSGSTQALTTYSSNWSILEGGFNVPSGANVAAASALNPNTARWNADVFDAAHWSEVEITAALIADTTFGGPAVRCQSGANTSYHCETNGTQLYVSKTLAGVASTLAGPITVSVSAGDKLRLYVSDNGSIVTLQAFVNGAQVGSNVTDSSSPILTAGFAGIFCYDFNNAGQTRITNFLANNTNTSSPSTPLFGQACL